MSVFEVQLNNVNQGTLDDTNPSIQRSAYIEGPHLTKREIIDGTQFTDVNYYKRYCYPALPLEEAILNLVSDDGSIWSDVAAENTFPVSYSVAVNANTVFAQNTVNITALTGGYAIFAQLTNASGAAVTVQLNGTATFALAESATQIFNEGDFSLSTIAFSNATGGNTTVSVLLSVTLVPQS